MTIFIQSLDYQLWNIITNGPEIPTKLVDGQRVLKMNNEFNDHDYKLLQLNATAKHVIFCALSPSEFNRVSSLESAKEMWDSTNKVKDTKINKLEHDYKLFTMLENENISSMYARFNDIINALKGLGKVYTNHELVKDLLGSLMTHELRMSDQAKNEPKKKTVALKASKDEESDEDKDE
ncbi:UBN2 domain-containing protein, partial [Cephalotus follicularis]